MSFGALFPVIGAGIAVAQTGAAASTGNPSVSLGSAPVSTNMLVAVMLDAGGNVGAGSVTVSQGASNFTLLGHATPAFGWAIYTLSSPNTGTTISTSNCSANFSTQLFVWECSGVKASSFQDGTTQVGSNAQPGSLTASVNGDIFFTAGIFNTTPNTISADWTTIGPTSVTNTRYGNAAHKIQGTAATETPSWTTSATSWMTLLFAFEKA